MSTINLLLLPQCSQHCTFPRLPATKGTFILNYTINKIKRRTPANPSLDTWTLQTSSTPACKALTTSSTLPRTPPILAPRCQAPYSRISPQISRAHAQRREPMMNWRVTRAVAPSSGSSPQGTSTLIIYRSQKNTKLTASSPCTMSPNPLILDNYTCPAEDLLSDPYLSTFTTFNDIPDCPFMAQKPEPQTPETLGACDQQQGAGLQEIPICWDHGCNGKVFSSWSNLRRHQRERACQAPKCYCPRCGAHFSRTTARNQHLANMSCKRIRRYSNGRTRPSMQKIQETYGAQM